MTACSPRRASGQLNVPALGWALRDAQHRGGAVRTATSPGVWAGGYQLLSRSSGSAEPGPLTSCGAAGPREAVSGGPCPGGWHSCGWVCAEGTELRASGDKKLSGGKEAGRRKGEQSDHLLKSDRVGWEAPGRLPKPPGVRGGAAKGPSKETFQSRGWRPGMDRTVPPPPPPGVPALRSPSLRRAQSARTVSVGPEQAATASSAGWKAGGSARHHGCGP